MRKQKFNISYLDWGISASLFLFFIIFFGFFYKYHLYFEEQLQLFLFTGWYFKETILIPGGLINYAGEFLVQFYHLPFAGALIIGSLLTLMQRLTAGLLKKINRNPFLIPLSAIPALNYGMLLTNEFFPLSGAIGLLLALVALKVYMAINKEGLRIAIGLVLIPVMYFLAGGAYLIIAVTVIIITLFGLKGVIVTNSKLWKTAIFVIIAGALVFLIPFYVRNNLLLTTPLQSVITPYYYKIVATIPDALLIIGITLPILILLSHLLPVRFKFSEKWVLLPICGLLVFAHLGFGSWVNMASERIKAYDFFVRYQKWQQAIAYAESHPPRNNLSLCMLNFSLCMAEKMGDKMFHYRQNGLAGLFLPFDRENVAPMMGNEILFHLGFINASQHYAFESMETTPNFKKPVRMLKRLAETNLINGDYAVASKYINLLKKTLFYSKWAYETEQMLGNEAAINAHPLYGTLRSIMVRDNYFIDIEKMPEALSAMLSDNPHNRMAFEYLNAIFLLAKSPGNLLHGLNLMYEMGYERVPVHYQEAIFFALSMRTQDSQILSESPVTESVKQRMYQYAGIYTSYPNAQELLARDFSTTYWYYYHYE